MVIKKGFTLLVANQNNTVFRICLDNSVKGCLRIYFMSISDPWKILENKYFQILVDRKAFLLFKQDFRQDFDYFPWKSKFWNVDNIEN